MAEYIEREAAIKAIESVPDGNWRSIRYAKEVKAIPAADVAPVRHGRWIKYAPHNSDMMTCSEWAGDMLLSTLPLPPNKAWSSVSNLSQNRKK